MNPKTAVLQYNKTYIEGEGRCLHTDLANFIPETRKLKIREANARPIGP